MFFVNIPAWIDTMQIIKYKPAKNSMTHTVIHKIFFIVLNYLIVNKIC